MVVPYALRTECSAACRRTRQRGVSRSGLGQMFGRLILYGALALALGIVGYTLEPASSLSGPSGQAVTISGNALFGARFQNASTQNPNGTASFTGSTDMKPTTPLIKEVKLVEDFERVLLWGTGLDHLACPKVSELAGPFRVVLDFH